MPLSDLQRDILRLLATHRDPESYVAGGTPLNQDGPRYSDDIDIFHDREERVAHAADVTVLRDAGFTVAWFRREPGIYVATIVRDGAAMRLEWGRDSDFRFFPALPDETFGYRLHMIDIATNKALAAAGRREPRDVLDMLTVHEKHATLGAVIWAAFAKNPGFSPESLSAEIRRNARYLPDDYADLAVTQPIDAGAVSRRLRAALDAAEAFAAAMPHGQEGKLFLLHGRVVQPDANRLETYAEHSGRRGGHGPSSSEIGSAMLSDMADKAPPDG